MKHKTGLVCTFLLLLFVFLPGIATAQSNEIVDRLLEQDTASYSDALYMVRTAAGETAEISALSEKDGSISLGEYAHLLMNAFDLPGGIMYRLFPGPRYAAREIAFYGFIRGSHLPGRPISGREVINILRRAMEWKEESA